MNYNSLLLHIYYHHKARCPYIAFSLTLCRMTFDIFTKLYNTLVQSVINYGAAIWGQRRFWAINAVQQRAMKYYLGLPKRAPNAAATGDTGWKS